MGLENEKKEVEILKLTEILITKDEELALMKQKMNQFKVSYEKLIEDRQKFKMQTEELRSDLKLAQEYKLEANFL